MFVALHIFPFCSNISCPCFYTLCEVVSIFLQIAEEIRHVLDAYEQAIPSVLEIPSKDFPYDASKDSILKRAKVRFFHQFVCYHSHCQ